jgi:hypothetical protein
MKFGAKKNPTVLALFYSHCALHSSPPNSPAT